MNARVISTKNHLNAGCVDHYRPLFLEAFPVSRPSAETLIILGGVLDYHYVTDQNAVIKAINEQRYVGFIPRLKRDVLEMHERSLVIDALRPDGSTVAGVVFTTDCYGCPITPYADGRYRNACKMSNMEGHTISAESGDGMLGVDPAYRFQGLARRIYQLAFAAAAALQLQIVPSRLLEADGRAFWKSIINQPWATIPSVYLHRIGP